MNREVVDRGGEASKSSFGAVVLDIKCFLLYLPNSSCFMFKVEVQVECYLSFSSWSGIAKSE